jgi:hypothetical protein
VAKKRNDLLDLTNQAQALSKRLAVQVDKRKSAATVKQLDELLGRMRYVLVKQPDYKPPGSKRALIVKQVDLIKAGRAGPTSGKREVTIVRQIDGPSGKPKKSIIQITKGAKS